MYPSKAYDEIKKQMQKLYDDHQDLSEAINLFDNGYEPDTTHPVQEDINFSLGLSALFAGRKIKKAKKKTFEDLRNCIRDNDMIMFYRAIKFGEKDLTERDEYNYSLLDWSIYYNNPIAVEILLQKGVDPNDFHPSVGRPLLNALTNDKTYYGKHACAHLLMERSLNFYKTNENGENAVMKIIKLKLRDLYEKLSPYDFENAPLTENGETMLHYAARYGENEIIEKAFNSKINLKNKTAKQETLLHILAARDNKEEFINKVINEGVDVNATDVLGNTALHYAGENAQDTNTEILLKNGANPLAINFNQESPIDKLNRTTSSNYKAISKTATLLSKALNNAYQQILEKKIPHSQIIATQKPLFDLKGQSNQHTLE